MLVPHWFRKVSVAARDFQLAMMATALSGLRRNRPKDAGIRWSRLMRLLVKPAQFLSLFCRTRESNAVWILVISLKTC